MAPRAKLRISPPIRTADRMGKQYAEIDRTALRVAEEVVPEAARVGTAAAVSEAVDQIDQTLQDEHPDRWIRERAQPVAEDVERRHAGRFFGAAALALGVRIFGTDDRARPLGTLPGITTGGDGGVGSTRRNAPRYTVSIDASPGLFVSQFVDENVRLVSTVRAGIPEAIGDQVLRDAVFTGGVTGAPLTEFEREESARRLLRQWREQGVPTKIPIRRTRKDGTPVMLSAEKHVRLIARDQVSKLNGQLNRARQVAAGISRFVWLTQRDPRVRDAHAELQGRVFGWEDGAPGVGIPGQPIQCRCYGGAVVDPAQAQADTAWIPLDQAQQARRFVPGTPAEAPGPGASIPSQTGRRTFDPDT